MLFQSGGVKSSKKRSRPVSKKRSSSKKKVSKSTTSKKKTIRKKASNKKSAKLNPWQRFLKKHSGQGHSQKKLLSMYRKERK